MRIYIYKYLHIYYICAYQRTHYSQYSSCPMLIATAALPYTHMHIYISYIYAHIYFIYTCHMWVSADPLLSVLLLPYADSNSHLPYTHKHIYISYVYAHIYFIHTCHTCVSADPLLSPLLLPYAYIGWLWFVGLIKFTSLFQKSPMKETIFCKRDTLIYRSYWL